MSNQLIIEKIEVHQYQWEVSDLAADDYYNGFNTVYAPGTKSKRTWNILKIFTDRGNTGAMKVAHTAEVLGMDLEIHAPGPAQRHCMAAVRNANQSDALDAIDENGHVPVPDGPGLGVEIDWEFVEKHRIGMTNYPE